MSLRAFTIAMALLIGGALLWVVTAGSDDPDRPQRATSPEERKAVRIESRLAQDPTDKALMVAAMKTWIEAGSDRFIDLDFSKKPVAVPAAVREDNEAGLRAWNKYLRQTDGEASADLGEMAAGTYFQMVEIGSRDPSEATAYAAGAVRAQKIVCKHEPSFYTLSDLAVYQYFNGEIAEGDKTAQRSLRDMDKSDWGWITESHNGSKERAERFTARVKRGFETLEETGEEELETPIKGYGGAAGLNGYEPEPGSA